MLAREARLGGDTKAPEIQLWSVAVVPLATGWAHDEAQGRTARVSQDCGLNSPRNFAPRFGPVF